MLFTRGDRATERRSRDTPTRSAKQSRLCGLISNCFPSEYFFLDINSINSFASRITSKITNGSGSNLPNGRECLCSKIILDHRLSSLCTRNAAIRGGGAGSHVRGHRVGIDQHDRVKRLRVHRLCNDGSPRRCKWHHRILQGRSFEYYVGGVSKVQLLQLRQWVWPGQVRSLGQWRETQL